MAWDQRKALHVIVAAVVAAAAIITALRWSRISRQQTPSALTAKHAIQSFLASKTKSKTFSPDFDFDLPDRVVILRSNIAVLEARQRTPALKEGPDASDVAGQLEKFRQDLAAAEKELGPQENTFIRKNRAAAENAPTYEALYTLIGEMLAAADRLLTNENVARRQMGYSFAREAARHAGGPAASGWLAARICEAYLWPHLDLADYKPGTKERAYDVLRMCRAVFANVDETNNIMRNYELLIDYAPTSMHADTNRYEFAQLLERSGNHDAAARLLAAITDTNLMPARVR